MQVKCRAAESDEMETGDMNWIVRRGPPSHRSGNPQPTSPGGCSWRSRSWGHWGRSCSAACCCTAQSLSLRRSRGQEEGEEVNNKDVNHITVTTHACHISWHLLPLPASWPWIQRTTTSRSTFHAGERARSRGSERSCNKPPGLTAPWTIWTCTSAERENEMQQTPFPTP